MSFPDKDYQWKTNVVKKSYINLGIDIFEFLYFPKMDKNTLEKFIKFKNFELVKIAKSQQRGTFFLSGHFSNWELTAFAYSRIFNDKLNIIIKIQTSRELNKKINDYRMLSGNEVIEIGFSLKEIFKKLRDNEIVCFLVDQSAHPDYSTYINFFGKNVPAFSGPAKIALKHRPELLLAYGLRNNDYTYIIDFEKIRYDDLIESTDENVIELTQRIQSKLEEVIRANPGQWLWFHKRFKHVKN